MSRFNTSFFTFTFVALVGFNQCCFATRANSEPSSATASTTFGAAACELLAVLFFCLFAGGMIGGYWATRSSQRRVAVEQDAPGTLGNFVNRLGQRGTGKL